RHQPIAVLPGDLGHRGDGQAPLTTRLGRFDGGHAASPLASGGGSARIGVAWTTVRARPARMRLAPVGLVQPIPRGFFVDCCTLTSQLYRHHTDSTRGTT